MEGFSVLVKTFKKLSFYILSFLLLSCLASNLFALPGHYHPHYKPDPVIANIIDQTYQKLVVVDPHAHTTHHTQTLTYLGRKGLRDNIGPHNQWKIQEIGTDFFEHLLDDVIKKEIEFEDEYYVFYHGQKREFIFPQDLYEGFYKIKFKQALKDFFMLRIPTKPSFIFSTDDFEKFKTIKEFIKKHIDNGEIKQWDFDEHKNIKKVLLAVNPSLFGNNFNGGESSFNYFINSGNASWIDITQITKDVFEYFEIPHLYTKHKKELDYLAKLVSTTYDAKETGILLQIFIPKKIVDDVAYRCKAWGLLHYQNPNTHPASLDLEKYKQDSFTFLTPDYTLDEMQFRLLLNNQFLLNPKSGVKFFRYYNETERTKGYKSKLQNLLQSITTEVA